MSNQMYTLVIHYVNGSSDSLPFNQFDRAKDYCISKIDYAGGKVRRVEIHMNNEGSIRAMWDITWDSQSKFAGLYNN